jgi:hypothetical protein
MPELVKIPKNGSMGYRLLFFSKDDLHSMISDPGMYHKRSWTAYNMEGEPLDKPLTFVVYLSFDTLQIPYEVVQTSSTTSNTVALAITKQPISVNTNAGANVTFSVEANGSSPLTYQWLYEDGEISGVTNVSGNTTSNLTLKAVQLSQGGRYSAKVKDGSGQTRQSSEAVLVVDPGSPPPIRITKQPSSTETSVGSHASFSVSAKSALPLSYQWLLDGTNIQGSPNITGTTNSVLTLSNIMSGQSGKYSVWVTDTKNESVLSSNATLTVEGSPTNAVVE